MRGIIKIVFAALMLLAFAGCVTMKNYRATKSQMLACEIELYSMSLIIDTLETVIDRCVAKIESQDSIIVAQKSQIQTLTEKNRRTQEEYDLLMDEFKKQDKKLNEIQKSSAKTKR